MFSKKPAATPATTATPTEQEKRRFTDNMSQAATSFGNGITLAGDLKGTENVELRGTVEGKVNLDATLLVCKGGTVQGDVIVKNIVVEGTVKGDIIAKEKIELRDACQVIGNLQAGSIAISEGAFFQGTVKMLGSTKKSEPVTYTEKRAEV